MSEMGAQVFGGDREGAQDQYITLLTMPKVSVIIPNYNHAPYLRQRIDSVLQQSFQDLEVILMDDCSTDGSRSIISEYTTDSRVRTVFNAENSGSTFKQWNKGVRMA